MPGKFKIVYLIDRLNIGGTEKQLLAIINRLDRKRFEPLLFCLRPSEYFYQVQAPCSKHVLNVGAIASLDGFKKLCKFSRFLRKHKIDMVQTFFFDSTVFGILAAKLACVGKTISCRRDMGFWYTPRLLMVLRVINMMTDRILVNSNAIKRTVAHKEHVRPGKIAVIYNGIDLEPFSVKYDTDALRSELSIPAGDRIVGIVANLNRRVKRVDRFVSAAAHILKKEAQVSFVIVGEGHLRTQLEHQISELGISEKIHFVGSQDNVIPYLQLFDIGVLTSESEGFSNSILEYMAAGLPVVCFDSGGNGELIRDGINGFLLKDFRGKNIADRIFCLLYNMHKSDMGKNNLRQIRAFSWDAGLIRLKNFYLGWDLNYLVPARKTTID